jgi:hypothetical protein
MQNTNLYVIGRVWIIADQTTTEYILCGAESPEKETMP